MGVESEGGEWGWRVRVVNGGGVRVVSGGGE